MNRFLNKSEFPEYFSKVEGTVVKHNLPKRIRHFLYSDLTKRGKFSVAQYLATFRKVSKNYSLNHVGHDLDWLTHFGVVTLRGDQYQVNPGRLNQLKEKLPAKASELGFKGKVQK